MVATFQLLLTHVVEREGALGVEAEVFRTDRYEVVVEDERTVVSFVDVRTGRPVTLVTERDALPLGTIAARNDLLHVLSIGLITDGGDVEPIVTRAIEVPREAWGRRRGAGAGSAAEAANQRSRGSTGGAPTECASRRPSSRSAEPGAGPDPTSASSKVVRLASARRSHFPTVYEAIETFQSMEIEDVGDPRHRAAVDAVLAAFRRRDGEDPYDEAHLLSFAWLLAADDDATGVVDALTALGSAGLESPAVVDALGSIVRDDLAGAADDILRAIAEHDREAAGDGERLYPS